MIAPRQPLQVVQLPDPTPRPTDAVVRVSAYGTCRADWHLWNEDWTWGGVQKPLPFTLSHEMCGVVVAVGSELKAVRVGERVIVLFHMACGVCSRCIAGRNNLGDDLATIPETVDGFASAALGCRYMTAYRGVTVQGRVKAGEWVVIHGCGGVGLSAIQIAVAHSALVAAIDIDDAKFQVARQQGAAVAINAKKDKVVEALKEATGEGAHLHHHYSEMLALVERELLRPQALVTRSVGLEGVDKVIRSFTDYGAHGYEMLVPAMA